MLTHGREAAMESSKMRERPSFLWSRQISPKPSLERTRPAFEEPLVSVDDRAGAPARGDSITDVNHAVEKLIPFLYQHADATACRYQNIYACKGFCVYSPEAKTVFLLVLVYEMNSAGPRRNLDFAGGAGFPFVDLNGSGPGQGLFSCLCCTCCSHGDSPF